MHINDIDISLNGYSQNFHYSSLIYQYRVPGYPPVYVHPPVPTGLSLVTLLAFGFGLLVLRLACLSNVKIVFWHVLEHHNLQVSVPGYKLVT